MPSHFGRFRILNGDRKELENVEFEGHLRVTVDEQPEIIVPPGEKREVPEGAVTEIVAEELP
jgi:hypothetical protein